ncbi:MAG: polymerase beta domain protein region [Flavipsychrobacter sp.]|nr:polymerase beta domain protein region [Flavipsychrobacter sp.]
MVNKDQILKEIKDSVHATDPTADIILYGSYARGDYNEESDIDILVLIDKEKVSWDDRKRIGYPLYDIGLDHGILISKFIYPKKSWENPLLITPFYENVKREGVVV